MRALSCSKTLNPQLDADGSICGIANAFAIVPLYAPFFDIYN